MADEQFTDDAVELVAEALSASNAAARRAGLPVPAWCDLATAALRALAEDGRLLPPGASMHAKGTDFASEHTGHRVEGLADPLIEEVGSARSLAAILVEAWQSWPGTHRVVSRQSLTYVTPWVPVDEEEEPEHE